MKIEVGENLSDYKPPEPISGKVLVRIERAEPTKDGRTICLHYEVADSGNEEDIGRTGIEFLRVNLSDLTPKGLSFLKGKLSRTCKAFDVDLSDSLDSDDFIGKEAWVIIKPRADQNGVLREQFQDFPVA
jgi:hypothetical protein